jgi:hypothetical protein
MSITRTRATRLRPRRLSLAMIFAVALATHAFGQAKPRVVVEHTAMPNDPVELVGVEVSGEAHEFAESQPHRLAASFDAPEDWLRRVAFRIRNKSDKTLLGVTITGSLEKGEAGEVPMGIEVHFGQELDESAFTGAPPHGVPGRLPPGASADVRWSESELSGLETFLSKKRPVADYRKARVEVREARFDDGTVWSMGRTFRIDPLDPRKWTPLDGAPTFPGATPPGMKAGERVIEIPPVKPAPESEAISITEIKVAGQSVVPGQPFPAGEDWLHSLTVRIRNTSTKPINYVQLNFGLPEASYHAGGLGFMLCYGKNAILPERAAPGAKPLPPGEEAELSFTEEEYERNRGFTRKMVGTTDFSRLRMGAASVVFADGVRAFVFNAAGALAKVKSAAAK